MRATGLLRAHTTGRIFPLGGLQLLDRPASQSRRVQARIAQENAARVRTNNAIVALNSLASEQSSLSSSVYISSLQAVNAVSFIHSSSQEYSRQLRGVSGSLADGQISDVLSSVGFQYGQRGKVVPFKASRLSLPSTAAEVSLLSVLPAYLADRYAKPEGLVIPHMERERVAVPRMKNRAEYLVALRRLEACGMLAWRRSVEAVNGLFAVEKDGDEDRLVVNLVPGNACFVQPDNPELPSPELLSRLDIPQGRTLRVGKRDISSMYYRFAVPEWLIPFSGLHPVKETELPEILAARGTGVWYPCFRALPMGWSHSVLLAQAAHRHLVATEISSLSPADELRSDTTDWSLSRIRYILYIDDLIWIGLDGCELLIEQSMLCYDRAMARRNLPVKHSKSVSPFLLQTTVLGLQLNCMTGRFGLAPVDLERLCNVTRKVALWRRCNGRLLANLLGKWTWPCLVRRPLLSNFSAVYRFLNTSLRGHTYVTLPMWSSVRVELLRIVDLAPLLFTQLFAPWFSEIVATDASEEAQGVCATTVTSRREVLQARSSPPEFVLNRNWRVIVSDSWLSAEHINILEARALITGVRWVSSASVSFQSKVLIFSDSQVVVGAVNKGRSSSFRLLLRLRSLAASLLACGLHLFLAHVPGKLNPTDEPSRPGAAL